MSGGFQNLLGIDAATGCLGVIARSGDKFARVSANVGLRHGESLLPWIERLLDSLSLKPTELELVVCSLGPGSFTGLRIALASAKGLALSVGCPLAGVGTLDVFGARYAVFPGTVFPVIDARKNRVYTAAYECGRRVSDYLDIPPHEVRALAAARSAALLTGPDAGLVYPIGAGVEKPSQVGILSSHQELTALLELGEESLRTAGPLPDGAGPIYVRPSEAEIFRDKKTDSPPVDPV